METNASNSRPTEDQTDAGGSIGVAAEGTPAAGPSTQLGQANTGDPASTRRSTEDGDSAGTAEGYLQEAKAKAAGAAQAAKTYAKDAVNAAGEKIESMKGQASELRERSTAYVSEEPWKAVVYAAAGSAVLTALLLLFMRGRR